MKKLLLSFLVIATAVGAKAQAVVKDSVLLGAGYANQVWYSLKNDEQATKPKNEWDLAFNLKDLSSTIFINPGTTLWGYPKSTVTGWASVDTTGLHTWMKRYNTDETWEVGALGRYADPSQNGFDLDWGVYDLNTHHVTGDSIFIMKLTNGTFKKFIIQSLISGTFTMKFANLDGSDEQVTTIKKTDFANKLFAYVSMQNNQVLDREPAINKWDLLFTQYTDMAMSYTVTGVLNGRGVEVAEVAKLADKNAYSDFWTPVYSPDINIIGWDWKTYDMANSRYNIKDSLVYLIMTPEFEEYWKVIFTGFDNVDGKFVFSKQRLFSTSVEDNAGSKAASMTLFPNPATGSVVNIGYNLTAAAANVTLYVHDINGRVVYTSQLDKTAGMHQHVFSSANMPAGNYIVSIATGDLRMQQQLSVVK